MIQAEFYKASHEAHFVNKSAAKGKGTGVNDFLRAMGDKEVKNPSPKAKKPTIKVKSLRTYDKGTPQEKLFKQLYQSWKGTGSIKDVAKQHATSIDLRKKLEAQRAELKRLKDETKAKKLKDKLEKKKKQVAEKKKQVKKKPVKKEPVKKDIKVEKKKPKKKFTPDVDSDLSPSAQYRKYLKERKGEEFEIKKQNEKYKQHVNDINNEELADERYDNFQEQQKYILENIGDKSDERYQDTIQNVRKNEDKLYRDASFLDDPSPPNKANIETIKKDTDSLGRAINALNIKGAKISNIIDSPNTVSYKISFADDKSKAKGMRSLSSKEAKDIISSFIGKEENVTISEDRKAGTIDIHVPKGTSLKDRSTVNFKELLTDDHFVEAAENPAKLPIVLGKDQNNENVFYDFSETPHLLVSGATKSGKSVFLQGLINSIQMGKSPEDAKMILVDVAKKGAEFGMYNDSEYLDRPVATTAKEAEKSMRALRDEVEKRNKYFTDISNKAGLNIKNIEQWNKFITKDYDSMSDEEQTAYDKIPEDERKKMHRIIMIVDEAADLLNQDINPNAKKISSVLDSILAVGRSVGAHAVIATQSPAKQTIPGKLQKNLGAKMTFRLQNQNDAENIGTSDATDLLMYGDGYFNDPMTQRNVRLQSGYISEDESSDVAKQVKGEQSFIEPKTTKNLTEQQSLSPTTENIVKSEPKKPDKFKEQMANIRERLDEQRAKLERVLSESAEREKSLAEKKKDIEEKEMTESERAKNINEQEAQRSRRRELEELLSEPEEEVFEPQISDDTSFPEDKPENFKEPVLDETLVTPEGETITDEEPIFNTPEIKEEVDDDLQDRINKQIEELTAPVKITNKGLEPVKKRKLGLLEKLKKLMSRK